MDKIIFSNRALEQANFVSKFLKINHKIRKAIILGTGWKKSLPFEVKSNIEFSDIPGFIKLPEIRGHERSLGVGTFKGENVIVLNGRVHLNEIPQSEIVTKMARWQIQLLYYLGVRKLISTSAVGSISHIDKGSVAIIKDFFTLFSPTVLFGGEFSHITKALHPRLKSMAFNIGKEIFGKRIHLATHAMVRGPRLETEDDQSFLSRTNAQIVGMSQLPDAEIISLYRGFYMLGLCFVTNKSGDKSTHEDNLKKAFQHQDELRDYIAALLPMI